MATEREAAIYAMPSSTVEERQAQVDALIALAQDPTDAYDGHHGNDRSDESLEFAREHNPEIAAKIEAKRAGS